MLPTPLLDPKKFAAFMLASAIAALAVGMIVYRFSEDGELSVMVALFLFISDYLALSWLIGRNNRDKD